MSAAPPMDAASWERLHRELHPHDHAIVMYEDIPALAEALGRFVEGGYAAEDLMVFVHSFDTEEEAWALLRRAYPRVDELRGREVFVVSLYKEAFQGEHPRIDHEHVARIVGSLTKRAEERGHRALRIFVDASRIYFGEGRLDEWFAFESWLGRRLTARAGLVCAYRKADVLRPDIFPRALETHAYRFG